MQLLTEDQIRSLRDIDTPTIANAVENHPTRMNTEGFLGWNNRCQIPDLGVMVGQAVTATFKT
ncbi:MAG: RraA family protein, partial [Chloroflexota bacterium]|nr:RraA family protein [Chloroflexota bacterium]